MKKIFYFLIILLIVTVQTNAQGCQKRVSRRSDTLALKNDGTLLTWGFNQNGELGLGDFTPKSIPRQVRIATNWISISAGFEASAGLTTTGTIWTPGPNCVDQLDDRSIVNKNSFVQAGTATDSQMVSNSIIMSSNLA